MAGIPNNIKDKTQRRDVRRNTSNQIISYTLAQNSVEEYGLVKLPAVKEEFNRLDFERTITTNNSEFFVTVPNTDISIVLKNDRVAFPTLIETKYKWNGEIVRIGDVPGVSTYYYIEEGVYHKLAGNGIFNFLAEKLKKPLGFRVDNLYDYTTNQIDYGQNQFSIYDKQTYIKKSEAYLRLFEEGDDITPEDIMPNGVSTRQIQVYKVDGAQTLELSWFGLYSSLDVGGIASTRATWNINKLISKRDVLASIGEELEIQFTFPVGGASNEILNIFNYGFDLELIYGGTTVFINVKGASAEAVSEQTSVGANNIVTTPTVVSVNPTTNLIWKYTIPKTFITDELERINIKPGQTNQNNQPNIIGTPVGNI
jgi:hypothetical protein